MNALVIVGRHRLIVVGRRVVVAAVGWRRHKQVLWRLQVLLLVVVGHFLLRTSSDKGETGGKKSIKIAIKSPEYKV